MLLNNGHFTSSVNIVGAHIYMYVVYVKSVRMITIDFSSFSTCVDSDNILCTQRECNGKLCLVFTVGVCMIVIVFVVFVQGVH